MTNTVYVDPSAAPEVVALVRLCYPEYRGRKYRLRPLQNPFTFSAAMWIGGSKSYYVVIDMVTRLTSSPDLAQIAWDSGNNLTVTIPPSCAVVEHVLSCGRDRGVCVHVPADHLAPLLPAAQTVGSRED